MRKENKVLDQLFEELVPPSGPAETLTGELVRAINRIGYRFYNDGDLIGVGYGNKTCNAAARCIIANCPQNIEDLVISMWGNNNEQIYEQKLGELIDSITNYVVACKGYLDTIKITKDNEMFSYYDKDEDENYEEEGEEDYY